MKTSTYAVPLLTVAMVVGGGAHAQEAADAPAANNLGPPVAISAQTSPGVYRDDERDRRNAMIALAAVGVAAAVAAGAFDSSSDHSPPPVTPPPTHVS